MVRVWPGITSSSLPCPPMTAKPWGTSQSCSRLVMWKYTLSPTWMPSMLSGMKWLRIAVMWTSTRVPLRTMRASFSDLAAAGSLFSASE